MNNQWGDDSLARSPRPRSKQKAWFTLSIAVCAQLAISASSGRMRDGYVVAVQDDAKKSPATDQEAIQRGRTLFDASCSGCHGADGHGGSRGPSLEAGRFRHGNSDAALFRTITKGLIDDMPPFRLRNEEVLDIISFLRVIRGETQREDPLKIEDGRNIFFGRGNCFRCHMLNGQGGRLGPDLSNTDSPMTTDYLAQSIRDPSASLPVDRSATVEIGAARLKKYAKVTLIDRNGKRVTGVRLNEDSFSVQLMDQQEEIHLALKRNLKEVVYHHESMMPAYDERMLSNADLDNLIVFLGSLKSR
jgi:cytochrome c oxidase cbb3-type subunit III